MVLVADGAAWAGIMAARANRRACGTVLAVAAVGAVAAFAGPAGAWAVVSVGLFVVPLGLGEHFAQGRVTLDELSARLDVAFTATRHRELSQATQDLPDMTGLPARVSLPRGSGRCLGTSPAQR